MALIDKQLAKLLLRYSEFRLAILFGSLATEHYTSDSDIDLGLLSDGPLSGTTKLELIELIGAQFGRPVDIIDLYCAGEPIMGQVFKGKRLLGDNTTYAELLTKHLLDAADFLPLRQRILAERRATWIK